MLSKLLRKIIPFYDKHCRIKEVKELYANLLAARLSLTCCKVSEIASSKAEKEIKAKAISNLNSDIHYEVAKIKRQMRKEIEEIENE